MQDKFMFISLCLMYRNTPPNMGSLNSQNLLVSFSHIDKHLTGLQFQILYAKHSVQHLVLANYLFF